MVQQHITSRSGQPSHEHEPLYDTIIRLLDEQQRSISGLARTLKGEGRKVNKLILTGYLRALEDFGKVKVMEIPPAKVYSPCKQAIATIYSIVGEQTQQFEVDTDTQVLITIYVLQRLFQRPVFDEELDRCGFTGRINARPVTGKEREHAMAAVKRAGIPVKSGSKCYRLQERFDREFEEVLITILVEQFELRKYLPQAKQVTLGEIEGV